MIECAEGAEVILHHGPRVVSTTRTDRFGDFKFDGLAKNSGEYRLEIKFRDLDLKVLEARLGDSLNLGPITL